MIIKFELCQFVLGLETGTRTVTDIRVVMRNATLYREGCIITKYEINQKLVVVFIAPFNVKFWNLVIG